MMYSEFLQKSNLQNLLDDEIISSSQAYNLFTDKINPLYMISNFDHASQFCNYYKKHGLEKTINKIKRDFIKDITILDYPNHNGLKLVAFKDNYKIDSLYIGYTKSKAIKHIKESLFKQAIEYFKK